MEGEWTDGNSTNAIPTERGKKMCICKSTMLFLANKVPYMYPI